MVYRIVFLLSLLVTGNVSNAQDSLAVINARLVTSYLNNAAVKAGSIDQKIDKYTDKVLSKAQRLDARIKRKLEKIDSLKGAKVFANTEQQYKRLQEKLQNPGRLQHFIPSLDSLSTSLKFLQENEKLIAATKDGKKKLTEALGKIKEMEGQFQKAEEITKFLKERKEYLRGQLKDLGFAKEIKKLSKQAYYSAEQLKEYKAMLKDHKNVERKMLELLSKTRLFKDFMKTNSHLASLFRLPGNPNDPVNMANLSGLQTRTSVNALIQNQLAAGGSNAQQQLQQNIQQARSQLNELKDKLLKAYPSGGSLEGAERPEGFKINEAKTKTFFQRIKLGADFQTNRHNRFFPVNSDLGLSASYMLNSNSNFSLGTSFKIGWGSGLNHIRLSSQGVSLRSGLDWRLKGNLFIAGNYEQNYFSALRNIDQLRDYSNWKTSALLGLSKKYKAGKSRGGEIKLLYDLFYNRPPVRTQPLTIRFGYNLK
jgi:hypothetical protein